MVWDFCFVCLFLAVKHTCIIFMHWLYDLNANASNTDKTLDFDFDNSVVPSQLANELVFL